MNIGPQLKRLRNLNALTQEELASRADLTKGYISQLENDTTCPSIATLKDILDVFGVSMQEFFSAPVETDPVFGLEDRVLATDEGAAVAVELLVPAAQNRDMDPALVTLEPGAEMALQDVHEGEEFGYVLQGRIEVVLDNRAYTAKKNECFHFASDRHHAVRNIGKGQAQILWVVTPPTFDYTG